ncbi:hypothetical protein TcasGA2_TC013297 [Tribolium castaneum]|uniref:Uncharacterized protein n=1 Tax=Tribolium castaneum TaxID=7070 RepID=D6WP64_TRICA|nr:hypothetical protein TcasGA2_TC013297 [Tribolium castaneum]
MNKPVHFTTVPVRFRSFRNVGDTSRKVRSNRYLASPENHSHNQPENPQARSLPLNTTAMLKHHGASTPTKLLDRRLEWRAVAALLVANHVRKNMMCNTRLI